MLDNLFTGALTSLRNDADYRKLPPRGPPTDLPALSAEALEALQQTVYGQQLDLKSHAYHSIELAEDHATPRPLPLPDRHDVAGVHIHSIDGSNQRFDHASFYFIIARSALVSFKYSESPDKPYTNHKTLDSAGLLLVDGNAFDDNLYSHVRRPASGSENFDLLALALDPEGLSEPLLYRHKAGAANSNPGSQALGLAVSLQQNLELALLRDVPFHQRGVCIRDGPLFSTSVSPADTVSGLAPVFQWHEQVLVSVSKRVSESTLLLELLLGQSDLRDHWFPGQNITRSTLESVSTDSVLLPRIMSPGDRTPLVRAVPRARRKVVDQEEELAPLVCYYLSRSRPHRYIRMEVPQFMWERDCEKVEWALRLVAWQHELGRKAPLIQMQADRCCQLTSEISRLRWRATAALHNSNLNIPEVYV
ncbi:DNA double-strand break repair nuclease NurA [Candidatus Palauibacter polyketidifaciens]|uniref:DNA double-strand break repair nuclease NurA n=1 Tax=Candidatus Palauibacter polyketidifaciens TaxID=3056740 RepID=UPI002394E080|nr:DNA double-strand break repair nuclease NurA [Candidatus Palauibacter polyketidifaciens]MDE2721622.1 hypothetical protein [Candidatus Palauibacter polyketidifaciens]